MPRFPPPVLKQAGSETRYVACVKFDPKKNNTDYAGSKELPAVFLVGRFDHFNDVPKEQTDAAKNLCAGRGLYAVPGIAEAAAVIQPRRS